MIAFSGHIMAQRAVTGTVTAEEDDTPIPGVNVIVKGTSVGTVTDIDGNYVVDVPGDESILVFSFIGLTTQEVVVGSQSIIDIVMTTDLTQLTEIVITALGLKSEARGLGYATASFDGEELNAAKPTTVLSGLQGKVAGAMISNNSSDPGASTGIIIRGFSSIGRNNQPLFVIDGITLNNNAVTGDDWLNAPFDYGNGANTVNPDDIASVNVLKGAAATALYGSRAANGVVIIETKKGEQSGKYLGVSVSSTYMVSDVLRLPEHQSTFGQGWDGQHLLIENGSWGPKFDGKTRLWGNVVDNSQLTKPFVALPDNVYEFYDYGAMWNNSVSFNGGNDRTNFYASYGNVNSDGIYPTDLDSYKRNTFSLNGSHDAGRIRLSSSINYVNEITSVVPGGQELISIKNNLIQIPVDFPLIDHKNYEEVKFYNVDNYYTPYGITNPYYMLDNTENEYVNNKVFGKVELDVDILEWLDFKYRIGVDFNNYQRKYSSPIVEPAPGSPNFGTSTSSPGSVTNASNYIYQVNHEFFLNGDYSFSDDWNLNAFVGWNINERGTNFLSSEVTGLDIPGFYQLSNSSSTPVVQNTVTKRRLLGAFGQANISFRNMVFVSVSARNDWSSTLPIDNNSFFYPGATTSFVFSELIPQNKILSFGKLRAAYGKTGNDAGVYLVNPVFVQGSADQPFRDIDFPLQGQNAFEVSNRRGNTDLRPEITTELEVGFDIRFFNYRLGIDFSYYDRSTIDQILPVTLAASTGYTSQTLNLGEVTNKGIELLVTATPVSIGDFNWDLSVTYAQNDNEVVELIEGLDEISLGGLSTIPFVAVPGQPLGVFKATVASTTEDGRIIVDNNGIPKDAAEKEILGSWMFDYMIGGSTTFSWKSLSLTATADYRKGGLIYSSTTDTEYFVGNIPQTTYNDRRPFIIPNSVQEDGESFVENTTPISKSNMDDFYQDGGFNRASSFLLPRDFFKLRELVLSYSLPKSILSSTPIRDVQISFIGRNLYLWTPAENNMIDPEISSDGNDLSGQYGEFKANPTTRQWGGSLKFSF